MQKNFEQVMDWVLEHEGGFDDDPVDPGGPTKYGITIFDIATREGVSHTKLKRGNATWNQLREVVRALTLPEAKEIYRTKYWNVCRADELSSGVDYCVVDFGINSGTSRSIKYLQKIVGVVDDGKLGPISMGAINKVDPTYVINQMSSRREAFVRQIGTFKRFGKGWLRRIAEVRARSLKMARA